MTQAEADSVRVYADESKTTELAREIVSVTEMHVKIATLTSTTTIYVDYDGVRSDYGVTDTYGRNAVWSDYHRVYHIQAIVSGEVIDSTGNQTANSGVFLDGAAGLPTIDSGGQFGNAGDFGNTTQKRGINTKLPTLTAGGNENSSRWTQQCWFKTSDTNTAFKRFFDEHSASGGNTGLGLDSSHRLNIRLRGGTTVVVTGALNNGVWRLVHFLKNADTAGKGYLNGADVATLSGTGTYTAEDIVWGFTNRATAQTMYSGFLDEVRIRKDALSANWITTEYNNQSDEASFWGTWTDAGGTPSNGFQLWWA
jgi:hypothetical protein